ncbi:MULTISPECIES: DUF3322 domain-containing protein [unclassified Duganella]|uniref:DUF3322 domain-containing protein n=1 Tax=unclassified Duganella TaxID=2636909 RepID=UPI000701F2E4|nr:MULTISPECIES: Wadjet anti-phage system protein JetD domain-containing protein [unclassified Duganella]KQV42889.1 hypothetical protein ASD07_20785 [Duganella sp. Root336D2]KRB97014.1 hypothetical protein ASE26_02970 [Duganella sp. Root198D2]
MKQPDDVRTLLKKRFAGKHREWLVAGDPSQQWPLVIPLGPPSEAEALKQVDAVRDWASVWRNWSGEGDVKWVERRWRLLGTQRLPEALHLDGPRAVCAWIGELDRWRIAERRFQDLCQRWPQLALTASRLFNVLADFEDADFQRLLLALDWLEANPRSGLYPRQLPIAGLDTKWIEPRKGLLAKLLAGIRKLDGNGEDFHSLSGLESLPAVVQVRLLDPVLRARCGGLRDFSAPVEQLAGMSLEPTTVLVVENLQSGLALPDMPGTIALIALGYNVDVLSRIPWISGCRGIYWGDIDTHGYAILHRARCHLPQLQSLLMDEATLLQFSSLWTKEADQCAAEDLPLLQPAERIVYQGLRDHRWGHCLRLEQERISWQLVLLALGIPR